MPVVDRQNLMIREVAAAVAVAAVVTQRVLRPLTTVRQPTP
jgi:hypothetical protein